MSKTSGRDRYLVLSYIAEASLQPVTVLFAPSRDVDKRSGSKPRLLLLCP